jgi:hypothetical protein
VYSGISVSRRHQAAGQGKQAIRNTSDADGTERLAGMGLPSAERQKTYCSVAPFASGSDYVGTQGRLVGSLGGNNRSLKIAALRIAQPLP